MDPNLLSKENEIKAFLELFGVGKRHDVPLPGLWGAMTGLPPPPLDPPVAVRKVRKLLYAKWFHDTVYCIPVNDINRKLENVWRTFHDRPGSGSGVGRHYRANYSVVKCHLAPG